MQKIGIIVAVNEELGALKNILKITKEYNLFDLHFFEGNFNNLECIIVLSGIGKVNAARTTQILIDNFKIDCVFNIGVAGGLSSKLLIGDIVLGEKLVQHDFDITVFEHEKGYIPNVGQFIEADTFLLNIANNVLKKQGNLNFYRGTIASGDIFCTETKMSNKIKDKFNALCVEMEGASIAQVCFLSQIPFLVIRSISDVPNNHNAITYEQFVKESSQIIANVMFDILKGL